jgi:hypothetical protein
MNDDDCHQFAQRISMQAIFHITVKASDTLLIIGTLPPNGCYFRMNGALAQPVDPARICHQFKAPK